MVNLYLILKFRIIRLTYFLLVSLLQKCEVEITFILLYQISIFMNLNSNNFNGELSTLKYRAAGIKRADTWRANSLRHTRKNDRLCE